MTDLIKMKCIACQTGAPLATADEREKFSKQIPDWEIVEVDGVERLRRSFKLKDFSQALAFTNRIGEMANAEDHHPLIVLEWGKVTVDWWTHKIHGLHINDFIAAAKTDDLSESGQ